MIDKRVEAAAKVICLELNGTIFRDADNNEQEEAIFLATAASTLLSFIFNHHCKRESFPIWADCCHHIVADCNFKLNVTFWEVCNSRLR